MREFLKFYRWGIDVKLHMSIYTIALLFFACIIQLLLGGDSIKIITIFEMVVVSFIVAAIERACFPMDSDLNRAQEINRTIIWGICSNLLFIGSAIIFKWFVGIPMWANVVLLIILEGGLVAMWFAMRIVLRLDTNQLNKGLHKFQNK